MVVKKKDRLNMVNDFPSEHCQTGGVFVVAKVKIKRQAEPYPNDSQLGTLSVVSIWLMTLPSEHCYTGGMFMVNK